jgi:hypothetical protein
MYTGFYNVETDFIKVLQGGEEQRALAEKETRSYSALEGRIVARVIALLIKLGFRAFSTLDSVLKRDSFFEENFIILDDQGKESLYRGRFLIRTDHPGDQMNVWFGFLQHRWMFDPFVRFLKRIKEKTNDRIDLYSFLLSKFLVASKVLTEEEADRYETDPERVDLVLRFKDLESIYGLLKTQDLDMVNLMFKNLLQIRGNQNHLYKLGSITKNLQLALGL